MKKLFGEGGIVGFLSRHCEKIVFGIAVLLVIWIALPNSDRAPLDESSKGPDVLNDKIERAKNHLRSDSWPTIYIERFPEKDNYLERSRNDLKRVAVRGYSAPVPLDKPNFPLDRLRGDPQIYPLKDLHVSVTYGAVAMIDPDNPKGNPEIGERADVRDFPSRVEKFVQQFNNSSADGALLEGRYIVAVSGLVPIRQQTAEYEAVLNETSGYRAPRDTVPVYGKFAGEAPDKYGPDYYLVERAEVMADGTIGKFAPNWGRLMSFKNLERGARSATFVQSQWAGSDPKADGRDGGSPTQSAANFPDPKFVDSRFAMRVPPVLLRNLSKIANHPEISTSAGGDDDASGTTDDGETGPVFGGGLGGDAPPRAETPRPNSPIPGRAEGRLAEAVPKTDKNVDHLLFRYYDMDAEPGKSYVYRVKLIVEDPNFPRDPAQRPATRNLASEVIERLNRRADPNVWWRESKFETSPIARVPQPNHLLAGPVDPGAVVDLSDFEIRKTEKSVKMMALVWDEPNALDVPGILDASRGTVVNFGKDAEAIDPVAKGLRTLPGYRFDTDSIVLDIRGGDWLTKDEIHAAPGEILLLDASGNLIIRREVEGAQRFNDHTYPEAGADADEAVPEDAPDADDDGPRSIIGR